MLILPGQGFIWTILLDTFLKLVYLASQVYWIGLGLLGDLGSFCMSVLSHPVIQGHLWGLLSYPVGLFHTSKKLKAEVLSPPLLLL